MRRLLQSCTPHHRRRLTASTTRLCRREEAVVGLAHALLTSRRTASGKASGLGASASPKVEEASEPLLSTSHPPLTSSSALVQDTEDVAGTSEAVKDVTSAPPSPSAPPQLYPTFLTRGGPSPPASVSPTDAQQGPLPDVVDNSVTASAGEERLPSRTAAPHKEPVDRWDIQAALFGLSDLRTGIMTYPNPVDRVTAGMTLLPLPAKLELFARSGWVDELLSEEQTERAAMFADVVGRSKVLRFLVRRYLQQPHLWHDAAQELLDLAVERLVREHLRKILPAFLESVDSGTNHSDREQLEEVLRACHVRLSNDLLGPVDQVVLYSPGLRDMLRTLLNESSHLSEKRNMFEGPTAVWDAYVVSHRHTGSLLAGPHKAPFSFGETDPSVALADVEWREHSSSVALEEEQLQQVYETEQHSRRLARHVENWEGLSEAKQNELLFGPGATATGEVNQTASRGIFVVDVTEDVVFSDVDQRVPTPGTPPQPVPTETQEAAAARAEEVARASAYRLDDFSLGIIEPLTQRQQTIFQFMKKHRDAFKPLPDVAEETVADVEAVAEEEVAEDGEAGDTEAIAVGTVEANARAVRKAPKRRKTRGARAHGHEYLPGGAFRHAITGLVEDVHLSRLWEAFQAEEAAVLLDTVVALRNTWPHRVRAEVRRELATQTAFEMLFFSRDEVRAVTPPADTYARLWTLHEELLSLLQPGVLTALHAEMPWLAAAPAEDARAPAAHAFESLPLDAQVSYSCFGAAHLPAIPLKVEPVVGTAVHETNHGPIDTPLIQKHPSDLYAAFLATTRAKAPPAAAGEAAEVENKEVAFAALSTEQQFACAFPFPLSATEEAEVAGRCLPSDEATETVLTTELAEIDDGPVAGQQHLDGEEDMENVEEEEDPAAPDHVEDTASVATGDRSATVGAFDRNEADDLLDRLAMEAAKGLTERSASIPLSTVSSAQMKTTSRPAAGRRLMEAALRARLAPIVDKLIDELLDREWHTAPTTVGAAGSGHNRKGAVCLADESANSPQGALGADKEGRKKKRKKMRRLSNREHVENVLPPNQPPKRRGRPPKNLSSPPGAEPLGTKHASPEPATGVPKRRGRPPKRTNDRPLEGKQEKNRRLLPSDGAHLPKRRGRPPKKRTALSGAGQQVVDREHASVGLPPLPPPPLPKRRGRPPKPR